MTSFIEALQGFDFTAAAASQNVNITVGNGDNDITVIGDNAHIKAGNGNNEIVAVGDDDSVLVGDGSNTITTAGANTEIVAGDRFKASSQGNNEIFQTGANAKIAVGNGDNSIISYSNNATIVGGNGDNMVGSYGNNVKIGLGNGDNTVGFWGNNDVIVVGDGNNNVKSLDWVVGRPRPTDDISKAHNKEIDDLMNRNSLGKLMASGATNAQESRFAANIAKMASTVQSTFTAGSKSSSQVTGSNTTSSSRSWTSGNYRYTQTTYTTVTDYLNTYINYLNVSGVTNPTVRIGSGSNDIGLTTTGGANIIATNPDDLNNGKNIITVKKGGYQLYTSASQSTSSKTTTSSRTTATRIWDPLVIDFNQDGVVSATAGMGVDINGDGKADGAATNGDKMLALSDLNGNGQIDGAEVFGDQTIDPFTKQKLNAKNGFEALELLAKSAEKHTGISCIDSEGNVNLAELKRALNTKGVDLGFISGDNNRTLEKLEKVASINVRNYTENNDGEGDAYHAQQGTYTDVNGKKYSVHDVWFQ